MNSKTIGYTFRITLIVCGSLGAWAQTGPGPSGGKIPNGTTLPATCKVGDLFFKTDATAGQNLYECAATDTWTQQLNSGAGGASVALDNLVAPNINTSLLPQTSVDLGSTTKPFRDLFLFGSGTYATTYIQLTGGPTGTRVITLPDRTAAMATTTGTLTSGNLTRFDASGNVVDSGKSIDTIVALGIAGGSSGQVAFQTGTGATGFSLGMAYNDTSKTLGLIGGVTVGQTGTGTGQVSFNGLTSGTAILKAADVAGTPTLTLPSLTGTLARTVDNVATATALAANGTNCSAGQAALGVDASGNSEGCWTPSSGGIPATSNLLYGDGAGNALAASIGPSGALLWSAGSLDIDTTVLPRKAIAETIAGLWNFSNGLSTGSSAPSLTAGTGGAQAWAEGTAPSVGIAAGVDVCYADSTAHALKCSFNNDTAQALARNSSTSTTTTQPLFATAAAGVYAPRAITSADLPAFAIGVAVGDPAGTALATGVLGYVVVPSACTIIGWDILVDAGTATVDVWKIATGTALPTVTNTITASAKPAIASGTAIHSTTLTGWTTSVAANDIFGFNLDAVATAKYITVDVQCK